MSENNKETFNTELLTDKNSLKFQNTIMFCFHFMNIQVWDSSALYDSGLHAFMDTGSNKSL
jgi:hypothetical protein